jgi:proteasome alpha subunit
MTAPFYVAPEQVMKDRADYARKGIARGRSLVGVSCEQGILLAAENPSRLLRKIAEVYDRIAFAGVGKYNEFDQLRIAGVRHADLKGFSFSREDVDARSLANQYAQILGNVFTHEMKPLEVEILVAEVGEHRAEDCLFHIQYDGTLIDEQVYCALGGDAETVRHILSENLDLDQPVDLITATRAAIAALAGADRTLDAGDLELCLLQREGERRRFARIEDEELVELLAAVIGSQPAEADEAPAEAEPTGAEPTGAGPDQGDPVAAEPAAADAAEASADAGAAPQTKRETAKRETAKRPAAKRPAANLDEPAGDGAVGDEAATEESTDGETPAE